MVKLTARQEEYLLVLATSDGQYHQLSNLAVYFDVSKASSSKVIQSLLVHGMIQKDGKELCITEAGYAHISEKIEQWRWISRWLISDTGMEPLMAERDACTMVCELSQSAIKGMVTVSQRIVAQPPQSAVTNVIRKREAPFSVYKKGSALLSMGDKGFVKPATIVEEEGGKWLILETKEIRYSKTRNYPLEGSLDRLWYAHDKIWVEAVMAKSNTYRIPLDAMEFHPDEQNATLRIRARATVGIFSMPESEALLVLDCSQLLRNDT